MAVARIDGEEVAISVVVVDIIYEDRCMLGSYEAGRAKLLPASGFDQAVLT